MIKSAKLSACIKLAHKVTIYVPGTVSADVPGDTSAFIDQAAALLSGAFGGATSSAAAGYWLSAEHGLIKERTTLVFAYAAEKTTEQKNHKLRRLNHEQDHHSQVFNAC